MRTRLAWAGVLLVVGLGCRNPVQDVHLTPTKPRQGDTVKIVLTSPDQRRDFTVTIAKRTYPMFRTGDGASFQTFIGLDAEWKPDSYKIIFKQAGRPRMLGFRTLIVSSRTFPSEIIFLPKTKTDLTKAPHLEEAKTTVIDALNTVSDGRFWNAPFTLPVTNGRLRTVYGMTRRVNQTMAWPYHRGLDIAAPVGTVIHAADAGRVIVADRFPIQGRCVIVDHGQGVVTIYMHMSMIGVTPGTIVKKGDRLGDVGSDGFSTGPHLHWGVYVFGEPVDPWGWLNPVW